MSAVPRFFSIARPHDPLWTQLLSRMFDRNDCNSMAVSGMQNRAGAKTRTPSTELLFGKES